MTDRYVVSTQPGLYAASARTEGPTVLVERVTPDLSAALHLSAVGAADLAAAIGSYAVAMPYGVAVLLSLPYAERVRALTALVAPAADPLPSPLDPGPDAVISCDTCAHEPAPVAAPPCCTCWRHNEWEAGL